VDLAEAAADSSTGELASALAGVCCLLLRMLLLLGMMHAGVWVCCHAHSACGSSGG
jgi:hypothetical protein